MSLSNKELLDKCKGDVLKAHTKHWPRPATWDVLGPETKEMLWPVIAERYATEKAAEITRKIWNADPDQLFTRSEVESCIKDSLEAAAENAKTKFISGTRKTDNSRIEEIIDKSSITDTKNIKIK